MADFTFDCPSCRKAIQCDDAWSGHQIQCPICHAGLVVPANTPPPAPTQKEVSHLGHQLVSVPKGGSKLATAQSTNVARSSFGTGKRFVKQEQKKQPPLVKVGIIVGIVGILAVAVYVAWPYIQKVQENMNLKRRQAEKESGGGEAGHIADLYGALDATDPNRTARIAGGGRERSAAGEEIADAAAGGAVPGQPAVNTNTVIKPKWTLEVKRAEIPDGIANGLIAGTNFVCEFARLDRSGSQGSQYLLTLRQGKGATPDRGVAVYLRANAGEMPTNQNWTISQDTTGTTVSKIWKTDPKYQAKTQNYFKGYALKLELGAMSETGTVPGKIFLAFPDTEKSVVAGNFIASTASAVAQSGYDAAAQAQPNPVDSAEAAAQRQRFQQRYGIRP